MPGKEALDHIRKTDGCSAAEAIQQLRSAISGGAVGARLPDPRVPSRSAIFPPYGDKSTAFFGFPAVSPGSRQIPTCAQWAKAKIQAKGTVRFFGDASPWYEFEVLRENVLRVWTAQPKLSSASAKSRRGRPIDDGIRQAILALWPKGIPSGLKAKERDNKIDTWLRREEFSVPSGRGLARAVQRALKPRP
jgi:hypothetical protein